MEDERWNYFFVGGEVTMASCQANNGSCFLLGGQDTSDNFCANLLFAGGGAVLGAPTDFASVGDCKTYLGQQCSGTPSIRGCLASNPLGPYQIKDFDGAGACLWQINNDPTQCASAAAFKNCYASGSSACVRPPFLFLLLPADFFPHRSSMVPACRVLSAALPIMPPQPLPLRLVVPTSNATSPCGG